MSSASLGAERGAGVRRAVIASTVGTSIEWYDFILYSIATTLVFPHAFFPASNPLAGELQSSAIFAVGFLARPIGAVLFGHWGDRIGRKSSLVATLLLMGLGTLGVVSSDHAPYQFEGPKGKQAIAREAPFSRIPNGVPGLETRMPYLFSEGVAKGRIDLQTFVAVTATNPAKLFGLHPRKGSIACGMDADIGIWDPGLNRTVRNAELHHAVDHTPYEGMSLTGWPVTTLVRGHVVMEDGARHANAGFGQFQPRGTYPLMMPRNAFPTPFNPHTAEA